MKHHISIILLVPAVLLAGSVAGSLLPSPNSLAATVAPENRTVFTPEQAAALAQAWMQTKADAALIGSSQQILQWQGATIGQPVVYYDLDGVPTAYVCPVWRGESAAGYIILSYRARPNPVLEFSVNLPPHLRSGAGQEAAARLGLTVDKTRPLYLGPLDYFFEAVPLASTQEVESAHYRWLIPMGGNQVLTVEHQTRAVFPQDIATSAIPIWNNAPTDVTTARIIPGVPDYDQFFGPEYGYSFPCYSGCTPTAATNLAFFWGNAGYPNLKDANWRDTTVDLRNRMGTSCVGLGGATRVDSASPGLKSFAGNRGYQFGSALSCWPDVRRRAGCQREFTWDQYTAEIDQCRPALVSFIDHPMYGDHSTAGVGYDTLGGNYYIVHDNWPSTPENVWVLQEDDADNGRFLNTFTPPSIDHTPPYSVAIAALPDYQSVQGFVVSWSAADAFPGVGSYDVQYRDGASGAWQWWLRTTAATSARLSDNIPLQGRHTYYVRVRAHDKHCNIGDWSPASNGSTADASPPTTAVYSQPRYRTGTSFPVTWGGSDDLSGIASYDIQVKVDSDTWVTWRSGMTTTQATFTNAEVGRTYYFRSLGSDRAGNREPKSAGQDTLVTIARYSISGRVVGNRGEPAFLARVSALQAYNTPATAEPRQGHYGLFFASSGSVDITASSFSESSTLPPLKGISLTADLTDVTGVDLVLPPADNILQNSHFENDLLPTQWMADGIVPPTRTLRAHTGDYALVLGTLPNPLAHEPAAAMTEWQWAITQTAFLSATVTEPTLSWLYALSGTASLSDTLTVSVQAPAVSLSQTIPLSVTGWSHAWLALDSLAPEQLVTVTFVLSRPPTSDPLLVWLDEVTLGSRDEGPLYFFLPIVFR